MKTVQLVHLDDDDDDDEGFQKQFQTFKIFSLSNYKSLPVSEILKVVRKGGEFFLTKKEKKGERKKG